MHPVYYEKLIAERQHDLKRAFAATRRDGERRRHLPRRLRRG